jgi:hypothetical protein
MRSRGIILKKSFVLVGHFSGIRLLVRVKTLILNFTLKNASQGRGFQKSRSFIQGQDKGGFKIWKY